MKNTLFLLVLAVVLVGGSVGDLSAAAMDVSNRGRDYFVSSASLKRWSFGLYSDGFDRDLERSNGANLNLKSHREMLYLGYSVVPWMTPYLTGGRSTSKVGAGETGSAQLQYGAGINFNFIDHEVADSFLLEDRLRLNGNVEYTVTGFDSGRDDLKWAQLDAALTLGIVNDVVGQPAYIPESIVVFVGPIYSSIMSADIEGVAEGGNDFGVTIGMEVFYSPTISFDVRVNKLDNFGFAGGINLRF
jgi:hypothetical protein